MRNLGVRTVSLLTPLTRKAYDLVVQSCLFSFSVITTPYIYEWVGWGGVGRHWRSVEGDRLRWEVSISPVSTGRGTSLVCYAVADHR